MKRTRSECVVPVILEGPLQAGHVIEQSTSITITISGRFLVLPQMGGLIDPMGSSARTELEMLA